MLFQCGHTIIECVSTEELLNKYEPAIQLTGCIYKVGNCVTIKDEGHPTELLVTVERLNK